jgi:transposase
MLILALLEQNAVLRERLAALEAKLDQPPKTPSNSSLPPSQGHKSSGQTGPKATGKGHKGTFRRLHPNPTRVREVKAARCTHCGTDVTCEAQQAAQTYDRIDIAEIKPDVTRVVLYGGSCSCCGKRFKAQAPVGLEPGSPFGPNIQKLAVYLHCHQALPLKRLAQLYSDLLGLAISQGAIVNLLRGAQEPFARAALRIRQKLLCGTVLESDETSMRVEKQTWWNWVFHHGKDCCFVIEPSRGKDVVKDFLSGRRPDYCVSDRLAAQMGWANKAHQVCLAHILRDVQYAIDDGDDAFAPPLKALLAEACAIGQRRDRLKDATLKSYTAKLDNKLTELLAITPRGKSGRELQAMVKKYRQHFFIFLENRALPPTNNGSERALRPNVVFRKITQCFRSQWSPRLYADVRSVIETARRRAIDALTAISFTLDGIPLPDTG